MFTPLNIDRSACPVKPSFMFNRGEANLTGVYPVKYFAEIEGSGFDRRLPN
jgi:hypothetical protein